MTHPQLVRRLTALVTNLKQLRDRVDAISMETKPKAKSQSKPRKAAKASKNGGTRTSSIVGRAVVYGGLRGKIVERKGGKFIAKMENGRLQEISTVYVYRQMSGSTKPKAQKSARSKQHKKEAKVIEQLQTEMDKAVTAPAPEEKPEAKPEAAPQDQPNAQAQTA